MRKSHQVRPVSKASLVGGRALDRIRPTFKASLFGLFFAAATLTTPFAVQAQEGQPGYVDTTALNLRAGPGTSSAIVGILLKYDAVDVFGTEQVGQTNWYRVEAGGGYTNGYLAARYVQFGSPPSGAVEDEILDYGAKETPTLAKGNWKYVGAAACAECHEDSTGDFPKGASTVWAKTVHSSAHATLSRDYTKEIARRKRGIEDPANDWRCVKCHVTAFGAAPEQVTPTYRDEDGISCEACHGPGSEYAQEDHGPGNPNRAAMGFQILTNLTERREVCESCHNPRSPTYKSFNLREFSRSIAHWVDPGDEFYYEDAVEEATRRQDRVDEARALEAKRVAREAAEAERARAEREATARREREQANEAVKAEAEARSRAEAERAEADLRAEKEAARAREVAAAEAARKTMEAEEKRRQAEERRAAEARLKAAAAAEAERNAKESAAREEAERQALEAASNSDGVESFLEDVDETIVLNPSGKKYNEVEFPHLAHASNRYLPNGNCNDCHHTHEDDDESPEACTDCHDVDGDAGETRAKTRAVHAKNKGFPREPSQDETSCVGCHKSMNAALQSGARDGKKAPTKCTSCHTRKR